MRPRGSFSAAGHHSAAGLDEVLTVKEVAKRAGWSVSKMRRFLVGKNREMGGALLYNAGLGIERPRWTVTIRALRLIAPQWFFDPDATQRQIDYLADRIEETREQVSTQGRRISAVHQVVMAVARDVAEGPPRHLQLVPGRRGSAA